MTEIPINFFVDVCARHALLLSWWWLFGGSWVEVLKVIGCGLMVAELARLVSSR